MRLRVTTALFIAIILAASTLNFRNGKIQAEKPDPPQLTSIDLDARIPFESIEPVRLAVPFKAQVPPGVWKQTANCNPACFSMIHCYITKTKPTASMIREFNDWAFQTLGKDHNDYNGHKGGYSFTDLQKHAEIKGLPNARTIRANLPILVEKLQRGIPCIVSVKRRMDNRHETRHAMLAVGIDKRNIIVHDPGRSQGQYLAFPLEQFLEVWRSGNNVLFYIEQEQLAYSIR